MPCHPCHHALPLCHPCHYALPPMPPCPATHATMLCHPCHLCHHALSPMPPYLAGHQAVPGETKCSTVRRRLSDLRRSDTTICPGSSVITLTLFRPLQWRHRALQVGAALHHCTICHTVLYLGSLACPATSSLLQGVYTMYAIHAWRYRLTPDLCIQDPTSIKRDWTGID